MAIIKAKKYLGTDFYWWDIKERRLDDINNKTEVVLCLYADPSVKINNKHEYAPGIFPSCIVEGTGHTDDELVAAFLQQNQGNTDWKGAVDTDGSYQYSIRQGQVYIQISNCPITGCIRFAEVLDYKHICFMNVILININIYFDTITYDENSEPVINTDVNLFSKDDSKTKNIPWVADNYYKIPNTNIGESDYFISLVESGMDIFEVLTLGIQYGDTNGSIDAKL